MFSGDLLDRPRILDSIAAGPGATDNSPCSRIGR